VPYLGIVLNCAVRSDCVRYVSKSAVSARRLPAPPGDAHPTNGEAALDNNALLRAMEHRNLEQPATAKRRRARN
jgi:hypothetical protein